MSSVARRQERQGRVGSAAGNGVRRRPRTLGQKIATFFGYVTTVVLLIVLVALGYAVFLIRSTMKMLPDTGSLTDYLPGGATEIYATDKDPATGKNVVLGRVFSEYKEFAPITDIPDALQNATVAVEDERFYSHRGVDMRGIGRAVYRDLRGGKMGEGGSTLTQQLARNVILQNQKKNFRRKIQEAIVAIQLEKSYSKQQILEMYLNEVCYGSNAYGVKAAAKMYFGKDLQKLDIAEAALLAGLPQSPRRLDPFDHLDDAIARRNTVLSQMREQGYITPEQYAAARTEKPRLVAEQKRKQTDFKAPYFTTYVLRQLIAKYGVDTVYHGGLKVYTTLNYQMQGEAERAIANGVLDGHGDGVTQGALISLEPHTGYIRAMVGGVDYKKSEFNNITQGRRQPGSSFKVFVYTAAFMANPRKYSPEFEVDDSLITFKGGGKPYSPKNYDGRFHGSVSIRRALTYSYNVPAVKVANMIGVQRVVDTARLMGIRTSKLRPDLSIALGSNAVTPLELCSAYSTFPNHGSHAEPMAIYKVMDGDGKVLENNAPQVEQAVVPESVVADMGSMLHDVVDHGTAAGAKDIHEIEDAHGKTGTTNDNRDAWFVGYTPELTTAIWVCGVRKTTKKGKTFTEYPTMAGVTGGHVCAPIWARFMKAAVPIQRAAGLVPPPAPAKTDEAAKAAAVEKALKGADTAKAGAAPDAEPTPEATPESSRRRRATPPPFDDTVNAPPTPAPDATPDSPAPTPDPETALRPPTTPAYAQQSVVLPSGERTILSRPVPVTRSAPEPRALKAAAPTLKPRSEVTVTVCEETGLRATRWCPITVERTFLRGEAPRGRCNKHKPLPGDG